MTKDPLTRKQRRFVNEYVVDLNATQAAIRAGYAEGSAHVTGPNLLGNPRVAPAIDAALADRKAATEVTADKVIRELAIIAFSDMEEYADWGPDGVTLKGKEERATGRAVCKVSETHSKYGGTQHLELHSKTKALEMLARHFGMFTDRHELVSQAGITINLVEAKPPAEEGKDG